MQTVSDFKHGCLQGKKQECSLCLGTTTSLGFCSSSACHTQEVMLGSQLHRGIFRGASHGTPTPALGIDLFASRERLSPSVKLNVNLGSVKSHHLRLSC